MNREKSGILLRSEKFPGSKPPHGGSWLYDPETDTLTLLEPPTVQSSTPVQRTAKHPVIKLDAEKSRFFDLVSKPFLDNKEYEDTLSLWIKFSCLLSTDEAWRHGVKNRLTGETDKWKEVIREGARCLTETDREYFRFLLRTAGGDPLHFLNLTGIPLSTIFAEIEYIKVQKTARNALREIRQSKVKREDAAKAIRKVAPYLDKVRPFVDGYLWWADHLSLVPERLMPRPPWKVPNRDQYPRGDWLRSIAWITKNAEKLRLIPSGTDRKGGPRKDLLGYAAYKLRRICESAMEESLKQERDEERRANIVIGRRVLWGPLTALLMASFLEWFKRDTNPVRNVRNALKAFRTEKYARI